MSEPRPRIVILGAGVAGLSAACHLANLNAAEVVVLEKMDRVGGLATSFTLGPAIFDFGPHAFHSQEPHIIRFYQEVMQGQYYEIEKDVAIKFGGKYYAYPLNPVKALRNMPVSVSLKCALSYAWNLLTNFKSLDSLKTAEEFFVRNFGWELYRLFFEGYTEKVWGIHPRHLSAKFIRNRLPSANLLRILWSSITGHDIKIRKPHEVPLKLHIFYPKQGSIQFPIMMQRRLEQAGGKILLNAEVTAVQRSNGRVDSVQYRESGVEKSLDCDTLISTIPLTELVQKFRPSADAPTLSACQQLLFRPILIGCFWIKKPQIFPQQTIYYTNRIFNRLAQMNSYSAETTPAGTCGITAELTCRVDDPVWTMPEKAVLDLIVNDIEIEGLFTAADVLEGMVLRNPHGYPIYQEGFETHLRRLRSVIHEIPNLYVAGRQGMFSYAQMHYGVHAGMMLANHVTKGLPKPSLTNADTEDQFFA